MSDSIPKCLIPNCTRSVRSRGMCDTHYTGIAQKVAKGKFTWKQLEDAGACLPKKYRGNCAGAVTLYLKEKGLL